MPERTPHLIFPGGDRMPAIGLGSCHPTRVDGAAVVRTALALGYRHLDCASFYGNEGEIGTAIRQSIAAGVVRRDQLWITSKLWNDCHAPQHVRPALERSLRNLQVDHLDLYLIHWPAAHRPGVTLPSGPQDLIPLEEIPLAATWGAMEALVEAGLVRRIGVSNVTAPKLAALLEHARLPPALNQVERHPYLQQRELLQFCRDRGVLVTAYAPLGSPAPGQGLASLLQDPAVTSIAAAHGVSAARVLLAWGLAWGTAVIPKSVHRERLADNLAAADLSLSAEEMGQLAALDRGERLFDGGFLQFPGGPYSASSLWEA